MIHNGSLQIILGSLYLQIATFAIGCNFNARSSGLAASVRCIISPASLQPGLDILQSLSGF